MKNKKGLIIIILIIVIIIAIVAFIFINKNSINLGNIIKGNKEEIKSSVVDSKNGLYIYSEQLDVSQPIYTSCTVHSLDKVILIINDTYNLYDSTCMGVYNKESGKTSDLNIKYDEETKKYYIEKDDKVFRKNETQRVFYTHNEIAKELKQINLSNYKFVLNQTQFEGNYYNIDSQIKGISQTLFLNITPSSYSTTLKISKKVQSHYSELFSTTRNTFDELPNLYPFYDKVIVNERIKIDGKYKDTLKAISQSGEEYNLYNYFPIILNGETLDENNSFFTYYDSYEKKFHLLVSENETLCVYGSDSDDTTYYEFEIEYDYQTKNLSQPNFIGLGKKKDGCNRINKLVGE